MNIFEKIIVAIILIIIIVIIGLAEPTYPYATGILMGYLVGKIAEGDENK